jgi:hypothetical protein
VQGGLRGAHSWLARRCCWSAQGRKCNDRKSPLLAAIAALALAGAAHAQETDSDVASTGEQVFRRFASLCRDQKAACDAAFRFGALVGADAAMRCALADDRIACFKTTMNSQEFMEEERKAITGQMDPKQ